MEDSCAPTNSIRGGDLVAETRPTEETRDTMRMLRSADRTDNRASSAHLDDDTIAAVVDGVNPDSHREAITHLSECMECRSRLAAVVNLLEDDSVRAEVEGLEPAVKWTTARRWSSAQWGAIATLAAAAGLAIVLLGPDKINVGAKGSVVVSEAHREGTVTTTAPPRILSPAAIGADDSLRWTTVPGADLYRVQVWDHEGNVVLTTDTRDTTLVLPAQLIRAGGSYLWEVKARTGWDRWVSSEFLEFTVRVPSAR
jgi:hypothetical protein